MASKNISKAQMSKQSQCAAVE